MANIAELAVQLTARTGKFVKGMRGAGSVVSRFSRTVRAAGRVGLRFGKILAAVAVGALVILTRQSFKAIDATAKLADTLGLTTKQLTGYQLAAKISGVEVGQLNTGLRRLQKNVSDATFGLTTAIRAFDDLKLSAEALEKLSPDEQLKAIADAFKNIPTQAKRVRVALDLFGRSGLGFIKIFEQGSKGLEEFQKRAVKLGIAFSRVDAAKIEAANDAIAEAKLAVTGLVNQFAIRLAPAVELVSNKFTEWATSGEGAASKITAGLEKVARAVGFLGDLWDGLRGIILGWQIVGLKAFKVVLQGAAFFSKRAAAEVKFFTIGISAAMQELGKIKAADTGGDIVDFFRSLDSAVTGETPGDRIAAGLDNAIDGVKSLKSALRALAGSGKREFAATGFFEEPQNLKNTKRTKPRISSRKFRKSKELIKQPAIREAVERRFEVQGGKTDRSDFLRPSASLTKRRLEVQDSKPLSHFLKSKELIKQPAIGEAAQRRFEVQGGKTDRSDFFKPSVEIIKQQLEELKAIRDTIGNALIPRFT